MKDIIPDGHYLLYEEGHNDIISVIATKGEITVIGGRESGRWWGPTLSEEGKEVYGEVAAEIKQQATPDVSPEYIAVIGGDLI